MKKTVSVFLTMLMVLSLFGMQYVTVSAATVTPEYDEVYTELYRMDFDDVADVSASSDQTAFNAVYGSTAKLYSSNASKFNYTIAPKTSGSSDKYIQLDTDYESTDGHSALQITLPDGGFKANNGTYKISYDVKWNSATYKPFLKLKSYHYDPGKLDHWAPVLNGIAPISDAGTRDQGASKVYGTYGTNPGVDDTTWFTKSWNNDDKVELAAGAWHKVDIKIDTVNLKAYYYYNGKYIGCQQDSDGTLVTKYICGASTAKYIQIQMQQGWNTANAYQLDNITISHSKSAVANPEILPARQNLYKEVYRLDFDNLENREVETAGVAADASAFNTAYSEVASIGGNDTTYAWGIYSKEDNSSDKYLILSHSDLTNTYSNVVTLRLNLASDDKPAANTGIYKLSYDMRINDGEGQKPFMQLKTYHYPTTSYTDYFGPCLSAIGPMYESDAKDWTDNSTVYGTYSAHEGYGDTGSMEQGAWYPSKIGNKYALSLGKWHNVEILFDTNSAKADYYYDGVYVGTQKDATFAKNYLFGTNTLNSLQFQIFQGFQAKGFQIDNITFAKEVTSATMKADGFDGISNIDLAEDYKKLTLSSASNIGKIKNVVVVDGSTGNKVDITASAIANEVVVDFKNALSTNGVYNVYVVGENAYSAGKIILGSGATEVTENKAYLLNIDVTDDNGEAIAKGDTVTANALLRNGTGTEQTAYLIIAIYNGDMLSQVDFKPITSSDALFSDSISMEVKDAENVKVSAFVWNNLTDILPLGASYGIN